MGCVKAQKGKLKFLLDFVYLGLGDSEKGAFSMPIGRHHQVEIGTELDWELGIENMGLSANGFIRYLSTNEKVYNWNVTDKAGDGVARYRAAITGITEQGGTGSNPLNYVPVVFLVKTATGQNSSKLHVYMESYYTDSVTGQRFVEVIQAATGQSVSGNKITIDNLKAALDKWAKKVGEAFTSAKGS